MLIVTKFKHLLSDKFIRNSGWMGVSELLHRISRLVTTVVLARIFTPYDYGLIAVVYTTWGFGNIFTFSSGVGSKIVQASENDLQAICNTSYWLNWILCGSIAAIQALLAYPIAKFYGSDKLILPLIALSLLYLIMPFFLVKEALIRRHNKLKIIAFAKGTSAMITNLITALFAILGMGVWAVVLGMFLAYPVKMIIYNKNQYWEPGKLFKLEKWQEVLNYGANILGISLLAQLRRNIDYLIVGRFLGVDALGIYFFAFNAGSGISNNVITAFTSSMFPYFCEVRHNIDLLKERFFNSVKKSSYVIVPLILLQSSLAPFYVPIIFGQKWVSAIPVLITICLSVLPIVVYQSTVHLLNSVNKIKFNLYWNLIFTGLFSLVLLAVVKYGILVVAISVLICQILNSIFAGWVIKHVFKSENLSGDRSFNNKPSN